MSSDSAISHVRNYIKGKKIKDKSRNTAVCHITVHNKGKKATTGIGSINQRLRGRQNCLHQIETVVGASLQTQKEVHNMQEESSITLKEFKKQKGIKAINQDLTITILLDQY